MCLSIPAKVISINDKIADVSLGGTIIQAGLHLIDDVKIGDYILMHTGYAIQKISEEDAKESLKLIREIIQVN
ncbi:MAG: HypC/HybG/HupF family hydrogenase formation chaperone [Bacteroidia bacterium]|nr:HypC/HybG/HupF family hydrogenase formation chaperone [Bacteroidia bacterium]